MDNILYDNGSQGHLVTGSSTPELVKKVEFASQKGSTGSSGTSDSNMLSSTPVSEISGTSTEKDNEVILNNMMDKETKCTGSTRFRPLTVATMIRDDGMPVSKEDKKRLEPDDCYLIWGTCVVGSFGAFYEAAEGARLEPVTIKMYRPQLLGKNASGLEKKILSEIPKPECIPLLHRSFRFELQNVFILERLDMYPLQYRLNYFYRLDVRDAMTYFCEMIVAVAFLHSKSIIHRNIQLGSFWIQQTGHLKLTDFSRCIERYGRNCFSGEHLTNYTAPELLRRGRHTKMVDIWALGVVLYRMLTGIMPFRASNRRGLIKSITRGEEVYSPLFSHELADLCCRMLQKSPKKRFAYQMNTMLCFKEDKAFDKVKWTRLFYKAIKPGELHLAQNEEDDNYVSRANIAQLDLMSHSELKIGKGKKPFRYKDITTRSGQELFSEDVLIKQSNLSWEPTIHSPGEISGRESYYFSIQDGDSTPNCVSPANM